jgi:hypothetical protein
VHDVGQAIINQDYGTRWRVVATTDELDMGPTPYAARFKVTDAWMPQRT